MTLKKAGNQTLTLPHVKSDTLFVYLRFEKIRVFQIKLRRFHTWRAIHYLCISASKKIRVFHSSKQKLWYWLPRINSVRISTQLRLTYCLLNQTRKITRRTRRKSKFRGVHTRRVVHNLRTFASRHSCFPSCETNVISTVFLDIYFRLALNLCVVFFFVFHFVIKSQVFDRVSCTSWLDRLSYHSSNVHYHELMTFVLRDNCV